MRGLVAVLERADNKHEFIAGSLQIAAKLAMGVADIECIIFTERPPEELLILIEEFGRKHANPVVQAQCIQSMKSKYGMGQKALSRILGVSEQTVSNTKTISNLPKQIRDDAITDPSVGKYTLYEIAKASVSDVEKIRWYDREKELSKRGGKKQAQSEIPKITNGLQRQRRVLLALEKLLEEGQLRVSALDLRALSAEAELFTEQISRLQQKYGAL
jgi:hypothetical protein